MLIDELRQLASLSQGLHAPAPARKARPDTLKNREALFAAIQARDIGKLREALDTGVPVNIRCPTGGAGNGRSALWFCAKQDWSEGLRELLDQGADESKIEGYFEARKGAATNETCLETCAFYGQAECFAALFPLHSAAVQAKALSAVRHIPTYLACHALGLSDRIFQSQRRDLLSVCLPALEPRSNIDPGERAQHLAAFDMLAKSLGLHENAPLRESVVVEALRRGSVDLIQSLAKRSIGPDKDGFVEVVPAKLLWLHSAPAWFGRPNEGQRKGAHRLSAFNEAAHSPVRVGLATAALMAGYDQSGDLAYALLALDPLRKETMGSELGRHLLARKAPPALLLRLASLGEDLGTLLDDEGRNPLHQRASRDSSKADMEELAKLFPDWISKRDKQGALPIELVDAARRPSMSILFDKIGMRDGLGGKRGAKAAPAAKRRL